MSNAVVILQCARERRGAPEKPCPEHAYFTCLRPVPPFSRNVFDVVKNSFINSVSNACLETARRSAVFGLERNEYRKSILWGLTINLCRLRRHLTHKFPFLIVKEAAQRACIFGVENSQHLCPGLPVACLGATWIKETLRCVFRCQQKKTS